MHKERFISDDCYGLLKHNSLADFESLWSLELDWIEPPNYRRNGWSGVSTHTLQGPDTLPVTLFIKRQKNHQYRCLTHPFTGLPTLHREFNNIRALSHYGIGTLKPIYYGEDRKGSEPRAILITKKLEGFISLDQLQISNNAQHPTESRKQIVLSVANILRRLHRHHIQHGCLYDKHIFIKTVPSSNEPDIEVRLIDLEKATHRRSKKAVAVHDLDQLFRHSPAWFVQLHATFFDAYSEKNNKAVQNALRRKWRLAPEHRRPIGFS